MLPWKQKSLDYHRQIYSISQDKKQLLHYIKFSHLTIYYLYSKIILTQYMFNLIKLILPKWKTPHTSYLT